MSSKSLSQSRHLGRWDEKTKTVLEDILEFCLVYPEICQSLKLIPVFGRRGGGQTILKDVGGGEWDYKFKQNVLCHVMVYCVALYCHTMCYWLLCRVVSSSTVLRFVIVSCSAANYVNRLKNVFHKIIVTVSVIPGQMEP